MEVKDFIKENQETLLKLDRIGVKTISTAIDYLSITEEYEKYHWIEKVQERKQIVASRCRVSTRTVEIALSLLAKKL